MNDYFKMLQQFNNEDDDDKDKQALKSTLTGSLVKSSKSYLDETNNFSMFERSPYNRDPNKGFSFDSNAKDRIKKEAFKKGDVYDRYTGNKLTQTQKEAENIYGKENMAAHAAEGDHIVPAKRIYEDYKNSAWNTDEDIREVTNKAYNLEPISREVNNAKRDSKNREFLRDKEKLKEKDIEISEKDRIKGIIHGDITEAKIKVELAAKGLGHMADTFHESGKESVSASMPMNVSMVGISNIIAYIKREKTADEAIADSALDIGKSAAKSYAVSGGLTVVSRTLEVHGKNNAFLKSLSDNNVPAKVVSAVMMTGKTIKRYADGEIDTQECIIELGESGITCLTSGAGMAVGTGVGMNISLAVGQSVIPIPIIGAAIGAMIGAAVTSSIFGDLTEKLNQKKIDHEERLRIIAEKTAIAEKYRSFQNELQLYYDQYLLDCRICYDTALSSISNGLQNGNINEVISGSNQIIRKNGGDVLYENFDEFLEFISDDKPVKY